MPPPLDLAGRRFGKLLVLRRDGYVGTERSPRPVWLCRCDCGREERIWQKYLPYSDSNRRLRHCVDACEQCRYTRTCVVCSSTFVDRQARVTCSDACALLHQRRIDMDSYYRRVAADPDHNRKRGERDKARAAVDAEFAAHLKERQKRASARRRERRKADAEFRERLNAQAREVYAQRAEVVQARKRARRKNMTPEQKARESERAREYQREWRRQWREQLAADHAAYAAYLQYLRDLRAKRALERLSHIGAELTRRMTEGQNDE